MPAAVLDARALLADLPESRPRTPGWPLPDALAGLLPDGTLRRGSTLRVNGSNTLLLTLLGAASRAGAWCGAVGLPTLGIAAAAEAGVDLDRFALVPAPGDTWPTVVAALLDALDIVVVAPRVASSRGSAPSAARRLSARARERRAVLLIVGAVTTWEGADGALRVTGQRWEGVGLGYGRLQGRALDIESSGRRIGGRPRTASLRVAP